MKNISAAPDIQRRPGSGIGDPLTSPQHPLVAWPCHEAPANVRLRRLVETAVETKHENGPVADATGPFCVRPLQVTT